MCEATAECGKIQLRPRKALLDKLWAIHLKNRLKHEQFLILLSFQMITEMS